MASEIPKSLSAASRGDACCTRQPRRDMADAGSASDSGGGAGPASQEVAIFQCNICFETATSPVVTQCGHLFCWPCIHQVR